MQQSTPKSGRQKPMPSPKELKSPWGEVESEASPASASPIAAMVSDSDVSILAPVTNLFATATEVADMVWHDRYIATQVAGHHSLVTDTGRLKMLHRPAEEVIRNWDGIVRESSESSGVTMCPSGTLQMISQTVKLVQEELAPDEIRRKTQFAEIGAMIEFDAMEVVGSEDMDHDIAITARRVGDTSGELECDWRLENGNIHPKYFNTLEREMCGKVKFQEGETEVTMAAPIVNDPTWNMDAFYYVTLQPETIRTTPSIKAVVGRIDKVSVYQLNKNNFPADAPEDASLRVLVKCFLWHNFTELPRATAVGVLLMLYGGLDYDAKSKLLETTVNCISQPTCQYFGIDLGSDQATPVIWIAVISGVLFVLAFLRERAFRRLRLGGKTMRRLRSNLFNKMMQLAAKDLDAYDQGDVPKIIDTEVRHCINHVWLEAFNLLESCSKLISQFALMCWVSYQIERDSPLAMWALIVLPCMMLLMAIVATGIRLTADFRLARHVADAEEHWHAFVSMCETCRSVINGYRQCDSTVSSVDEAHATINQKAIAAMDSRAFHLWLLKAGFRVISITVTVIFGIASRSPNAPIEKGTFVMVLKTINDIGTSLILISSEINTMFTGAASVTKVAGVLNRHTLRQARLESGYVRSWRQHKQSHKKDSAIKEDEQKLSAKYAVEFDNVQFWYPRSEDGYLSVAISPVSGRIEAEQLVCFPRNELDQHEYGQHVGLDTLFKVIAGQLLPTGGLVRVHRRWRIIFVPLVPVLFDGTLMYNLAYSCLQCPGFQYLEQTAWDVCRSLGMSSKLIGKADLDVGTNGERLKQSDRLCVSLTRALLFDVEVLLVSSLLDALGDRRGLRVLQYLKQYISSRGCPQRNHDLVKELRHRKTVIYSTRNTKLQEDICDVLIGIRKGRLIEL